MTLTDEEIYRLAYGMKFRPWGIGSLPVDTIRFARELESKLREKENAGRNQMEGFEPLARELMKWLCDNGHPHMTVIITSTSAELLENCVEVQTHEYVGD